MGAEIGVIEDPLESFLSTETERIVARFEALSSSVGSSSEDIATLTVEGMMSRFGRLSSIENGVTSGEPEDKNDSGS